MSNPYPSVPDQHPFKKFLWGLAEEPACSPRPDIVELGTSSRYFVAFCGVNASARLRRFRTLFDLEKPAASIMSSKTGKDSANLTLFLHNVDKFVSRTLSDDGKVVQFTLPIPSEDLIGPGASHTPPFPQCREGEEWEPVNPIPASSVSSPDPIPGIKHMPSYP